VHRERQGVAFSRDEGVEICDTEYFLLLDGHMRFLEKGWNEKFVNALRTEPQTIFCGQTKGLFKPGCDSNVGNKRPATYGAYIDFEKNRWKALWSYKDTDSKNSVIEIPIILGASYACCKTFWQKLGGLRGLIVYGMDEQLISLKTWLTGGRCKLLKEVVVEHLYRKSFPYSMGYFHKIYNELYLSELLLPNELKDSFINEIIQIYPKEMVIKAIKALLSKEDWIKEQQLYYQSIFTIPFESVLFQNKKIKEIHNG
jgi:glycosyltransferase involved in cell wall biosynthesis